MTFIDFSKVFDYVQHEFLLYKLHMMGIQGKIYDTIKTLYTNPVSCVLLNGHLGEWFSIGSGVRQGNSLSPTLFACFINYVAQQINDLNVGIPIGEKKLNILLYADDIVLV